MSDIKDIQDIRNLTRTVLDFPIKGIPFLDILPIFQNPKAVEFIINNIVDHVTSTKEKIDVVVGLEARGFLFGPILALRLNAAFVPIRKKGKLPGKVIDVEYQKEYGPDIFEIQEDAIKQDQNVIVIDDLMATGGTAVAAGKLVNKLGGKLLEYIFVVELTVFDGYKKLDAPLYSVLKYDT
ncbi:adenine phosphoribosyltransferase [Rhizophagus irregularis]|uniref:adenine phosphoribosyltransferase n=3 Tax=Rhizophagus irregularis TaxID=588596 RepID=U9TNU5_RHIID|nr:adenine phosphoribosyltransferase [Rhizophagus irregularis DAOM 181602=DAOM 197198]EXX54806.1 adenine phosphoribosyltransferase APT1 [Rhizophagus irregularis DAOM 197198w]PKC17796.1 adenine phosphoribosyltransferase [Rhizophagus irregularis]PKC17801.1 adenine phosphoribosyltransferase [Rhizophagus irregularis]PKC75466.1 adenine phosphoribosyltransferase [Rhizophagus irregularis]PKK79948.1 adenine phosphoribosyltransferase [Rhizophagus irregularis]|eukprot:XP_025183512.1 adenine phosphoribosyltransferase [Rhizophagus irregularis DAOM 181602=DAOM 197198]